MSMLEKALGYADSGWRVLPLHVPDSSAPGGCSCRRADCASPAKHPRIREWQRQASTDEHDLRRWFGMWQDAGIGIAIPDNVMVLDVDVRHDGDATLAELEDQHGALPPTVECVTGGGGLHVWLRTPHPVRNSAGLLGTGLDVRGVGGFVVAPPSLHVSGQRYAWRAGAKELATSPAWLLRLLERGAPRTDQGVGEEGERVVEGYRDYSLFSLACALRRRGLDDVEIFATLELVNRRRCDPPMSEDELLAKTQQAMKYPPGVMRRDRLGGSEARA